MVKKPHREKSRKDGRRTDRDDRSRFAQSPNLEMPPTFRQRTRDFARSAGAKGTHDAVADLVKRTWLWGLGALVFAGALYFGVDVSPWLKSAQQYSPTQTGSNKVPAAPAIPDLATMNMLVACNLRQHREIQELVDRRKFAWSILDKCRIGWKATPNKKQTADEACAPHLIRYRWLAQEVKSRESNDECSALSTK